MYSRGLGNLAISFNADILAKMGKVLIEFAEDSIALAELRRVPTWAA